MFTNKSLIILHKFYFIRKGDTNRAIQPLKTPPCCVLFLLLRENLLFAEFSHIPDFMYKLEMIQMIQLEMFYIYIFQDCFKPKGLT